MRNSRRHFCWLRMTAMLDYPEVVALNHDPGTINGCRPLPDADVSIGVDDSALSISAAPE